MAAVRRSPSSRTRAHQAAAEARRVREQAARTHLVGCPHPSQFEEVDGRMQKCACFKRYQLALHEPVAAPLPLSGKAGL